MLSVELGCADRLFYNRRVPLPLALTEVEARLSSLYYRQPAAVSQDLKVIYENAVSFNGADSVIAKDARGDHYYHQTDILHGYETSPPSSMHAWRDYADHALWDADLMERLQSVVEGNPLPAAQPEVGAGLQSTRRRLPVGALAERGTYLDCIIYDLPSHCGFRGKVVPREHHQMHQYVC